MSRGKKIVEMAIASNEVQRRILGECNIENLIQDITENETEFHSVALYDIMELPVLISDNVGSFDYVEQITADQSLDETEAIQTEEEPNEKEQSEEEQAEDRDWGDLESSRNEVENNEDDIMELPVLISDNVGSFDYVEQITADQSFDETEEIQIEEEPNEKEQSEEEQAEDRDWGDLESSRNEVENNEEENNKGKKKKRRIHVRHDQSYTENKLKRQLGLPYKGKKKINSSWDYTIKRPKRILTGPCKCKLGNSKSALECKKVTEENRQEIFNTFWKMTWPEKKYASGLVLMQKVKRRRGTSEESRRSYSMKYHLRCNLNEYRVCKKMFIATLGLSENVILQWMKNDMPIDKENIENGDGEPPVKRARTSVNKEVVNRINTLKQFFNSLAKMESHYCRASSTKLYLEPLWQSKRELYRFYKDTWCTEQKTEYLSITTFSLVFDELNLSLYRPKKDQCNVCVAHKTNNIPDEQYKEHLTLKEEARNEKNADKISDTNTVLTMDLQSVLLAPTSKVSLMYYKTKLAVHNFTLYNIKTNDGYCYLWSEIDGSLSANEFSSILVKFIETKILPNITDRSANIILWSDGCVAQNRNNLLANALLNTAIRNKITIIQKYLYKGHTQMEADSMHSAIERRLRNREINVPADYVQYCRTARLKPRPYDVQYLSYTFFKDYSNIKYYNSIRPGRKAGDPVVTDLKQLKYRPDGIIEYKLRHTGEWLELNMRLNKNQEVCDFTELPDLYKERRKITKEKFQHLQQLKQSLEQDYHDFYNNIPHE